MALLIWTGTDPQWVSPVIFPSLRRRLWLGAIVKMARYYGAFLDYFLRLSVGDSLDSSRYSVLKQQAAAEDSSVLRTAAELA